MPCKKESNQITTVMQAEIAYIFHQKLERHQTNHAEYRVVYAAGGYAIKVVVAIIIVSADY